MKDALAKAGLAVETPGRGDNGKAGDAKTPGTIGRQHRAAGLYGRRRQQGGAADVQGAQQAVRADLLVTRSRRHPAQSGRQSQQGDARHQRPLLAGRRSRTPTTISRSCARRSTISASPPIPTSSISADHGFSTISKESKTSATIKGTYADTPEGFLPLGFLAIDLAKSLDLPLFDPQRQVRRALPTMRIRRPATAYIGEIQDKPELIIATNGGSDLIYLPTDDKDARRPHREGAARSRITSAASSWRTRWAPSPARCHCRRSTCRGKAVTPHPAIVVSFRSYSEGCEEPAACQVEVADTVLRQGQGMHGSFGRGDTMNFMAAIGPDFKAGFVDPLPVSNADAGMTAAHLLGLKREAKGSLIGRVMSEATVTGETPTATTDVMRSAPDDQGLVTVLQLQKVGEHKYFDVAGFPGRTVGLDAK